MAQRVAVLLIEEEHDVVREIHSAMLTFGGPAFLVVAAPTLASGMAQIRRALPDVVFISLSQPDGIGGIAQIREADPRAGIVALAPPGADHLLLAAIGAGAQELLVKGRFDRHDVVRAARMALERRRLEFDLFDTYQREREELTSLQMLDELKNTFLTAVSHELRAPLTSVVGYAHTLKRFKELADDDREQIVDRLGIAAAKLQRLLEELLDLDRLTRGTIAPNRAATDLSAVVRRVLADVDTSTHDVHFDDEQVIAAVDGAHVERIVENLVRNAVAHTKAGTSVWIRIDRVEDGVMITVSDAGPGVTDVDAKEIFQPFRRGRNAPEHVPGLGIGLSLVDRLARLHGGRASVREREGGGAVFEVFLKAPVIA